MPGLFQTWEKWANFIGHVLAPIKIYHKSENGRARKGGRRLPLGSMHRAFELSFVLFVSSVVKLPFAACGSNPVLFFHFLEFSIAQIGVPFARVFDTGSFFEIARFGAIRF